MNQELFEKCDNIKSLDKPEKVDECKDCATRGNCQDRGKKCKDFTTEDAE